MGARERAPLEYVQYSMLLATVWRHAAICELYRDETSLRWSHDASTDEAPPRALESRLSDRGVRSYHGRPRVPALTSARNG